MGRAIRLGKNNPFVQVSVDRGRVRRGKKDHFHLLDRYIRRVDALVPENMEHLVRPLGYIANLATTARHVRITFDESEMRHSASRSENLTASALCEESVRAFVAPAVPVDVLIVSPDGSDGSAEVFVKFATNEETQ